MHIVQFLRVRRATTAPVLVTAVVCAALCAVFGAIPASADDLQDLLEQGQTLLGEQKWSEAIETYQAAQKLDPESGLVAYQIGYAKIMSGDAEGSLPDFERAIALRFSPDSAQYNIACIHAIAGRTERALDAVAKSIELGMVDPDQFREDPDLAALRELPRFQELIAPLAYHPHPHAKEVTFRSTDGIQVFADFYEAAGVADPKQAPVLLLFHQAGSNCAEYQPIAGRLYERGFNCLAMDARGGGRMFGRTNATVDAHGDRGSFDDALQDFAGALQWIREQGYRGKVSVWGSSYSAGGLFTLIAAHPGEISGGLAFSPGRNYAKPGENGEPSPASQVRCPVFVCMPDFEYSDAAGERFAAIAAKEKTLFVHEGGRHGSSTLRPDRNRQTHESGWAELLPWLDAHAR